MTRIYTFGLESGTETEGSYLVIQVAHRDGKLVSLDPNYSVRVWPDKMEAWEVLAQILPYVTIVKPSLEDARRLFDYNMEEVELEEACLREFHGLGA